MIFTDYYKFEKLEGTKAQSRIDCTTSTKEYRPFEILRNKKGELFFYLANGTDCVKNNAKRIPDICLTSGISYISGIFVPDISIKIGFGDIKKTTDVFIILLENLNRKGRVIEEKSSFELFIARGQNLNQNQIYQATINGEFEEEFQSLREKAE